MYRKLRKFGTVVTIYFPTKDEVHTEHKLLFKY